MEDFPDLRLSSDDSFMTTDLLNYDVPFPQLLKEEPFEYAEGINNEIRANYYLTTPAALMSAAPAALMSAAPAALMSADSTQFVQDSLPSPPAPSSTSRLPSTVEFSGECEFELEISSETAGAKYVYSHKLNKTFVNMFNKIPLRFKWNQSVSNLFVRALPLFMSDEYIEEPVIRCISHIQEREISNKGFMHIHHVIRCEHESAVYNSNAQSGRLSVVVPLNEPQPGTDWVTIMYSFVCKNSCQSGMNRRATFVVFTLETSGGDVLGRKIMNVRVCSCPKRDRDKEERDFEKQKHNQDSGNMPRNADLNRKRSLTNTPEDQSRKKLFKPTLSSKIEIYNFQLFGKTCAMNTPRLLMNDLTNRAYLEERKLTSLEKKQIEECKRMMKQFTKNDNSSDDNKEAKQECG